MEKDILKQILNKLDKIESDVTGIKSGQQKLEAGQQKLEADIANIQKDIKEIKMEQRYMWEDIKQLDNRIRIQADEIMTVKRIK